jgi:hypothetical protein
LITVYHHRQLELSIVTSDGMPALAITNDGVHEYSQFVCDMQTKRRSAGKSSVLNLCYDIMLRCPDPSLGWLRT